MLRAFKLNKSTLLLVLPLCGLWFIGQGTYIHAKAILAQVLLEAAWAETLHGQKEVKPWPWADTWPVSRLTVSRLGISRIVLAGANGSSLAFGPGHLFASAVPGKRGNTIIAGHRDTHFRFIKDLTRGEIISLQTRSGERIEYEITDILIVDESETYLLEQDKQHRLTLVTCYPFDAVNPGGPLRYIVQAKLINLSSTQEVKPSLAGGRGFG